MAVGESYQVASGLGVYAGRPAPAHWEALTFASHSRKVITTSSPTDSATYSALATGAQADVEALTPQTVSAIPLRGYNILVQDSETPGTFYISGSLHSGYRGCEIDRLEVPLTFGDTEIGVTISHQPTAPPRGPNSGYATGLGGYIYKQSHAAESVVGMEDQTAALDWKPFIGHDWTMTTHTPITGFATMVAHAVQTGQAGGAMYHTGTFSISSGVLQSSMTQPSDDYTSGTRQIGLVGFDFDTERFRTYLSQLSASITALPSSGYPFNDPAYGLGTSGLSDWNPDEEEILFFNSIAGSMNVLRWEPNTNTVTVLASMLGSGSTAAISTMGGGAGHSENGWLIRHLEGSEYLCLRQHLGGLGAIGLFKFSQDYGSGDSRAIDLTDDLPGSGTGEPFNGVGGASDPLSYCVDKAGRRVFWLVAPTGSPIRVYVSSFDDLMNWTFVSIGSAPTWPDAAVWHTLNRQPMHYASGWLVLHDNLSTPNAPGYHAGAMQMKRAFVGAA